MTEATPSESLAKTTLAWEPKEQLQDELDKIIEYFRGIIDE